MTISVDIMPLHPFTEADVWPILTGYETHEVYQVKKRRQTPSPASIFAWCSWSNPSTTISTTILLLRKFRTGTTFFLKAIPLGRTRLESRLG